MEPADDRPQGQENHPDQPNHRRPRQPPLHRGQHARGRFRQLGRCGHADHLRLDFHLRREHSRVDCDLHRQRHAGLRGSDRPRARLHHRRSPSWLLRPGAITLRQQHIRRHRRSQHRRHRHAPAQVTGLRRTPSQPHSEHGIESRNQRDLPKRMQQDPADPLGPGRVENASFEDCSHRIHFPPPSSSLSSRRISANSPGDDFCEESACITRLPTDPS